MKTKGWMVGLFALILLFVAGWTNYAQKSRLERTRWEYRVVYAPGARTVSESTMNELGSQGWELVTFQAINNEGGTIGAGNYFFKRARSN